jgi:hypothetical protein
MDWLSAIVGTAAGAVAGFTGNALRFWRESSVTEATLKAELDKQEALMCAKLEALDEKFHSHVETNERDRRELLSELKDAARTIQAAALTLGALGSEQAVVNRVTTETLKGIAARQEAQAMEQVQQREKLAEHSAIIKTLQEGGA